MKEEKYDRELHDYMEGNLSGEELRQFEERMNADADLRNEVEKLQKVDHELKTIGTEKFTELVAGWEDEYQNQEKEEMKAKHILLFLFFLGIGNCHRYQ